MLERKIGWERARYGPPEDRWTGVVGIFRFFNCHILPILFKILKALLLVKSNAVFVSGTRSTKNI